MSKVVLVSPRIKEREMFPSGAILLLGTILRKAGHTVEAIHETEDYKNREDLILRIISTKPDVVGVTVTTFNCKSARELCRQIKEKSPAITVACGGPHTSALGKDGIAYPPEADIWVVGEGDKIILDIADGNIKGGIHFPDQLRSLDDTPMLDLTLTDIRKFSGTYPQTRFPSMFIMGSRGCPFSCTFCSRAVFNRIPRYRKPEALAEEAEKLITDFGVREIFFHDDTFNMRLEWVYSLLYLLRKKNLHKKVLFRTPCRVDKKLVTEDLLEEMKATNFWLIFFGVENGNPEMLKSMKKGITVDEIKRAFSLCHKVGIKTEASFIIGMPNETLKTIRDSEKLWRDIKPYWCSFSRAIPFPATEFYGIVKEKGHLLTQNFEDYQLNMTLVRTDELDKDTLEREAQRLNKLAMRQKAMNLLRAHPYQLARIAGGMIKTRLRGSIGK